MGILTQKDWQGEFVYEGVSYGLWNRGELTFGAESSEAVDPEDGHVPLGGRQTAENVEINRPWKQGRDTAVYRAVKPIRGRGTGTLILHERDPETNQPVSSTPLDTVTVVLLEVKVPEADVAGSDTAMISLTLQVRP